MKLVHLYAKSRTNLRITNQAKSATFPDVTISQHLGSVSSQDVVDVRMCIHHMSMYPYRAVHYPHLAEPLLVVTDQTQLLAQRGSVDKVDVIYRT